MAFAWFICVDKTVSGPLTTEDINTKVATGALPPNTFIWWKGQREWMPISFWQEQFQQILDSVVTQTRNSIWYIDIGTAQMGPFTQAELISNLKPMTDLAKVHLWAEGHPRRSLFEMHDVMELIGINRREYERTPLNAPIAVSRIKKNAAEFTLKAMSISEGGIGVIGKHDLRRGDEVGLIIAKSELGEKIRTYGEVIYVTETGFAGIQFRRLSPEVRSVITDYVRKFDVPVRGARKKAA